MSFTVACSAPEKEEVVNNTEKQTDSSVKEISDKDRPVVVIDGDFDSNNEEIWPNDFVKRMQDELGVTIQVKKLTNEQRDLYLASGKADVDILRCPSGKENQVVKSGNAVAFDSYLEEFGPNILKQEDSNNLVRELLSNGTGELYFKRVQIGPEMVGKELWNGYVVRWDLYKELGYPKMNNDDDYIAVLEEMVKMHPKTETGEKVYAMGIDNDSGLWSWVSQFEANDGVSNVMKGLYVDLETGQTFNKYTDDRAPFWRSMAFFNKLNQKGLLDPDSFTMTGETRKEKATKGIYVGGARTWDVSRYYKATKKEDPSTLKGFMSVFPDTGGMSAWYGASPITGWEYNSFYVPKSSKNIEAAIKVIDYFYSPQKLREFYSGVQGVHWDYVGGIPVALDYAIELKKENGDEWKRFGIGSSNRLHNFAGLSGYGNYEDGYPFNLFESEELRAAALNPLNADYSNYYGVSYPSQVHVKQVESGIAIDRAKDPKDLFMVLSDVPADMLRIDAKLKDFLISSIPIMLSVSEDEFDNEKSNIIEQLRKSGADELYDWAEKEYQKADRILQSAKEKYNIN